MLMWREGYFSSFQLVAIVGNGLKGLAWISSLFSWDSELSRILRQKSTYWGIQAEILEDNWTRR